MKRKGVRKKRTPFFLTSSRVRPDKSGHDFLALTGAEPLLNFLDKVSIIKYIDSKMERQIPK